MNLDIGAKKPIDGDQVFLVGRFLRSSEPPFVLLYDAVRRRRVKRNIQKIDPIKVVASIGAENFMELEYPRWGRVWFRTSKIRAVRALSEDEMLNSPETSDQSCFSSTTRSLKTNTRASSYSVWRPDRWLAS